MWEDVEDDRADVPGAAVRGAPAEMLPALAPLGPGRENARLQRCPRAAYRQARKQAKTLIAPAAARPPKGAALLAELQSASESLSDWREAAANGSLPGYLTGSRRLRPSR